MQITIPPSCPPAFHSVWLRVAQDGYDCARAGGFQEQNPYLLFEPLFDAWRDGWFEGVYSLSPRELQAMSKKVTPSILRALENAWKQTCKLSLEQAKATSSF